MSETWINLWSGFISQLKHGLISESGFISQLKHGLISESGFISQLKHGLISESGFISQLKHGLISNCHPRLLYAIKYKSSLTLGRPGGGVDATPPLAFFPCNFFYDSNRKNRLSVSVTRDGRHILTYVTSSWRCHVTYVMTSYVHDGGQNTLFLP